MACPGFKKFMAVQGETSKCMKGNQQGLLNKQTLSLPWEVPPDGWRLGEDSGSVPLKALSNLNTLGIPPLATFGDRALDKTGSVSDPADAVIHFHVLCVPVLASHL